MFLSDRIKIDLADSRINWKIALLFIPAAFFTYLFHEFGHWIVGELLGNDMVISLNNASHRSGYYIDPTHALYISMGGPLFTIIQALLFMVLIEKTKSMHAYPFVFFAAFSRIFSIVLGGFNLQDEAKISAMLNIGTFTVALIVILVLSIIVYRSMYSLNLSPKVIGYHVSLSTVSILLVIYIDKLLE
jgi:hypothetical protein